MRNNTTDLLQIQINKLYKSSGASVNGFINACIGAYDIQYLKDIEDDKYASFNIIDNGTVYTYYYWESKDSWFCKV